MPKNPNQKLKLLYLYQILMQKTDEEHKLTTDELIAAKASIRILRRCRTSGWTSTCSAGGAAAILSLRANLSCPSSSCWWTPSSARGSSRRKSPTS